MMHILCCRGAFATCQGPLDAQCRLLELMVIELTYDAVDVSNAISVIEAITGLLHQYIAVSIKVHMKHGSSADSSTSACMCFGSIGMLTGMKTTTNSNCDSSRDSLMCNLLKLLNVLVQIPLPNQRARISEDEAQVWSLVLQMLLSL